MSDTTGAEQRTNVRLQKATISNAHPNSQHFLFLLELIIVICEIFTPVKGRNLFTIPKKVICFIACITLFLEICGQNIAFNHLTVENGLSNNAVLTIAQDRQGFMWYGTGNGLNRYDGRHFKIYKLNREDSTTISDDNILSLLCDASGTLWIGTSNGLNKYDQKKDAFDRIPLSVNGAVSHNRRIHCLYEDKKSRLWVGTQNGLFLLSDRTTLSFQSFFSTGSTNEGLADNTIRSIFEDRNSHLWIGTNNGLTKMKWVNGRHQYETFRHDPGNPNSLSANYITTIAEDARQNLWIGTQNSGVNVYNTATGSISRISHSTAQASGIVNNNIRKIISDKTGKLWVGTQEGLSIIEPVSKKVNSYQHDASNNKSLSQNSIYSLFVDANGSVWIGTYFGGVNIIYSYTTSFTTMQNRENRSSISNNVISSVVEDDQHNLWIGTEGGGLNYLNRQTNQFTVYKNKLNDPSSLGSNLVKVVYRDKAGNIWAGTHGGGLNLLEPGKTTFKRFLYKENDPETLNSEVFSLVEDSDGRFWVGASSGLHLFRRKNSTLEPLPNTTLKGPAITGMAKALIEGAQKRIWIGTTSGLYVVINNGVKIINPYYNVNCLQQDAKGNIWAGLYYGGLMMYDVNNEKLISYTEKDGLPNNNVLGILEDDNRNLWLSTDNGLVKFNPAKKSIQTYTVSDGLTGNEFNYNSFFKDSKGEIFFGGYNGLNSFYPGKMETNKYAAPIVFTGLKLFNNPVGINGEDGLLKENISDKKHYFQI